MRTPVAAKMALVIAGTAGGIVGSPSQVGSKSVSTNVISMLPGAAEYAEISDQAAEQLANLALTCAKQTKVGKARLDAYIEMATWQLTSAGLAPEVSARGIDPATLGAIMNVGAGRANPSFETLSDADVTRMMVALKAKGVNVDALDTDAWHVAGAWLEATSRAYRAGMPGK